MASTIYPAAQNMIVAARSLGIGTCFTTFPGLAEPEIRTLCNVPEDLHMLVYVAVKPVRVTLSVDAYHNAASWWGWFETHT